MRCELYGLPNERTHRPPRVALLTSHRHDWASSIALLCPGLEFVTLPANAVGLSDAPNPFALPEDDVVDVVLMTSSWYGSLEERHPDRIGEVMRRIDRCCRIAVGLDAVDEFALSLPPHALDRLAIVIKPQGVYRDRELYNYMIGCWYDGAIWAHRARPRRVRYCATNLEKLRLSVPCFLLDALPVRRAARRLEGGDAATLGRRMSAPERGARNLMDLMARPTLALLAGPRRHDVHCVTTLTHVDRIESARLLEGLSGHHGLVPRPGTFIAGTRFGYSLPQQARNELLASASPYFQHRVSRLRYRLDLRRHRLVVAPTGYGELGQRHAEAWRAGAAVVCQDVSHVEMMFPLQHRHNVVFCRPDLSDLRSTVEELLADRAATDMIALTGHREFASWEARWKNHLRVGIEAPIREALGMKIPVSDHATRTPWSGQTDTG